MLSEKYQVIGESVIKKDALQKVTGKSRFAADLKMPGMLQAKVLRSAYAHAEIKGIDTSAAQALPGVAAVLTWRDVPGSNAFGIIVKDEPVLAKDRVRCFGDAVAIVAAETEEIAQEALGKIKVDYQELPPLFSPAEALAEDAPQLHEKGNILLQEQIIKGDADQALAGCPVVITQSYTTQMVEHCYIEPEAGIAYLDGEVLVIKAATQNPHYDRRDVAANMALPQNRVRIVQTTTGGGFGGKLDISVQVYLAMLAMRTKRPVRMVYDREESFVASSKRHPFTIQYTTGASRDGKIQAVKVDLVCDTGAYASYGPATIKRAMVHVTGPYEVPHVQVNACCVYTNNPRAGAFRGFGVPQAAFAHESQMDALAAATGLSAIEVRMKNALQPGAVTATGQVLGESVGLTETLAKVRDKMTAPGSRGTGPKRRGAGTASMWYGIGNTAAPNPSGAFVDLLDDGSVLVLTGCADIGQGSDTILAQIAAEEIGCQYDDVLVLSGDTGISPDAGASSASRQTYISGNAVRLAAKAAKQEVLHKAAELLASSAIDSVTLQGGQVYHLGQPTPYTVKELIRLCRAEGRLTVGSGYFNPDTTKLDPADGSGRPYATYAFATQTAEVEVDTETGKVEVLKIIAAHDVGTAINPRNILGQVDGGCAMGVGYALTEEVQLQKGAIKNPRLSEYLIPTTLDMPAMDVSIVESCESTGPFGAKGVGEPALIPTAAAIANAIHDAIGIRFTSLPITPEKIVAALKEQRESASAK